jgi:hypothetical protein
MKRAAIYARVSTHNGQNPEMQLDEVREYCRQRGWKIVKECVDEGISGSKEHRPALATRGLPEAAGGCGGGLSLRPLRPQPAPVGERTG